MKPTTGAVLRMLGYVVEIGCLSLWMRTGADGRTIAGVPVRSLLLGGAFCGMLMIFLPYFLVKKTQRAQRPPRDFLQ